MQRNLKEELKVEKCLKIKYTHMKKVKEEMMFTFMNVNKLKMKGIKNQRKSMESQKNTLMKKNLLMYFLELGKVESMLKRVSLIPKKREFHISMMKMVMEQKIQNIDLQNQKKRKNYLEKLDQVKQKPNL